MRVNPDPRWPGVTDGSDEVQTYRAIMEESYRGTAGCGKLVVTATDRGKDCDTAGAGR